MPKKRKEISARDIYEGLVKAQDKTGEKISRSSHAPEINMKNIDPNSPLRLALMGKQPKNKEIQTMDKKQPSFINRYTFRVTNKKLQRMLEYGTPWSQINNPSAWTLTAFERFHETCPSTDNPDYEPTKHVVQVESVEQFLTHSFVTVSLPSAVIYNKVKWGQDKDHVLFGWAYLEDHREIEIHVKRIK